MLDKKGDVAASGRSVMEMLKTLFSVGVDVPVRVQAPSSQPATPAPNKTSSITPSIRNNVTVNVASGDPNEIAQAVSRKIAESTAMTMRGNFADNALS